MNHKARRLARRAGNRLPCPGRLTARGTREDIRRHHHEPGPIVSDLGMAMRQLVKSPRFTRVTVLLRLQPCLPVQHDGDGRRILVLRADVHEKALAIAGDRILIPAVDEGGPDAGVEERLR